MDNRVQLLNKDANILATIMLNLPFSNAGGLFTDELSRMSEMSKALTLAVDLCTNVKTIKKAKEDLLMGKMSAHQVLSEIITDWIKKNKTSASLDRFVSVVSSNGLDFEDLIKTEFLYNQSIQGPEDKALANLVILREIYKNLDPKSQRMFLQVCSSWRKECLGLWRKNQPIKIFGSKNDDDLHIVGVKVSDFKTVCYPEEMRSISPVLPCLYECYKAFLQQKDLSLVQSKHSLANQPFRRFSIIGEKIAPLSLASSPELKFFWNVLAPHATHLELKECSIVGRKGVETIRWLLLKGCPRLEVLRMINCRENKISENIKLDRKACASLVVGDVAQYLHSIYLNNEDYHVLRMLEVAPNLKELSVSKTSTLKFSNLLQPIFNNPLPITKLEFEFYEKLYNGYDGFFQYSKISPNIIKELKIHVIMFKNSSADFVSKFFSGIAHCKELKKLHIEYGKTTHPCLGLLTPFRAIKLPKLTTLFVDGHSYDGEHIGESPQEYATFDLKVLAGMPRLEVFKFFVKFFHSGGIKKWVEMEAEPDHQIRFEGMQNVNNELTGSANLKSFDYYNDFENYGGSIKPSRAEVEEICKWGVNLQRINGYRVRELLSMEDHSS